MPQIQYNYAMKVFNMFQRNEFWVSLQSDYDVKLNVDRAIVYINSIHTLNGNQIVRADEEAIEKYLGELEILIRRIFEIQDLFQLAYDQREDIVSIYYELEEKYINIQQKRASWS